MKDKGMDQETMNERGSHATTFDAGGTDIQEYCRGDGRTIWRIALDRTEFSAVKKDTAQIAGRLIATARSGAELTAEILQVEADGMGMIWHHTAKPLQVGTAVHGEVD